MRTNYTMVFRDDLAITKPLVLYFRSNPFNNNCSDVEFAQVNEIEFLTFSWTANKHISNVAENNTRRQRMTTYYIVPKIKFKYYTVNILVIYITFPMIN